MSKAAKSARQFWLMKSEPDCFSLDDLKRTKTNPWDGVRNYQARNYMRDQMRVGDGVLFYHSSCAVPGIAGLAEVARSAYPDYTAWDTRSDHYDPKASPDNPIWQMVDVRYVRHFRHFVPLDELRAHPALTDMLVLRRGQRLSIQPVVPEHYTVVVALGQ